MVIVPLQGAKPSDLDRFLTIQSSARVLEWATSHRKSLRQVCIR